LQNAFGSFYRPGGGRRVRPRSCANRLRDPFGGFSGGVVAELLPNVGAYNPVVEVVVWDNVNSSGCHRGFRHAIDAPFCSRPAVSTSSTLMFCSFAAVTALKARLAESELELREVRRLAEDRDGAVTSVNFSAIEKSGEADSRQWVSAPCAARWHLRIPQAMIATVQSSRGPPAMSWILAAVCPHFRSADVGRPG
jgi:hypothetical protein